MRLKPLIAVNDVQYSSTWYQRLLACGSGHGGPDYVQLVRDGEMLMQLHHWRDKDHPNLGDPDAAPSGYGVLLWFETDDFDASVLRARALRAKIVREPTVNPNSRLREYWVRDPDGYFIVIAGR